MQERGQAGVPQGHGSYEEMSISQEEIDEILPARMAVRGNGNVRITAEAVGQTLMHHL